MSPEALNALLLNQYHFCSFLLVFQEFENKIKQWCKQAGEDVSYQFLVVGRRNHSNFKQLVFGKKKLVLRCGLFRTCRFGLLSYELNAIN